MLQDYKQHLKRFWDYTL